MARHQIPKTIVQALALAAILLAAGCAPPAAGPLLPPAGTLAPVITRPAPPTETAAPPAETSTKPAPTMAAADTPTPAQTATPQAGLCSPLEDIALAELGSPDLLKQPFQRPRPGLDDGHHGVDFAYWSRGERKTMLDLPVYSVLEGTVAAVLDDRIPYGYTVIIETPLDHLPPHWIAQAAIPTPAPTLAPGGSLRCPPPAARDWPAAGQRSLYLLYAHLSQPPAVTVGQAVACGENIGLVGTTGNSVNYHLHFETRVGPVGVVFEQMAHYDNRSTESEMRSYCTWRVSDMFQMFNPMEILSLQP